MLENDQVGAVVLAAGMSRRMGQPKMTLPWRDTTVIGKVVQTLQFTSISPIVVVTGGSEKEVVSALHGLAVETVHNPDFDHSEMLQSMQTGLRVMPITLSAVLVCLGDQPQIEQTIVEEIVRLYRRTKKPIIVPSYQLKRGHPWLVDRIFWSEILSLGLDGSLRQFLKDHQEKIFYLNVNTSSVLKDLDTPEDYAAEVPGTTGSLN